MTFDAYHIITYFVPLTVHDNAKITALPFATPVLGPPSSTLPPLSSIPEPSHRGPPPTNSYPPTRKPVNQKRPNACVWAPTVC